MARWWSEPGGWCVPPRPCPGCGVPDGDLHRAECPKDRDVLEHRIREALEAAGGFRQAVARLAVLLTTPALRWWPELERQGVTLEELEEALASVLRELLEQGTQEAADTRRAVYAAAEELQTSPVPPVLDVLGRLASQAYQDGLRSRGVA